MNSIWNNNIKSFQVRFPALAQVYESFINNPDQIESQISPIWKPVCAKNGETTASTVDDLHLHSSYNPSREAYSAVSQEAVAQKSTSIFLGFGLGYHAIEWAKLYKNDKKRKLILIEPTPLNFFAAMLYTDWTQVFEVENLVIALACPADSIMGLLEDSSKINTGDSGVSDSFIFNIPAFSAHAKTYFDIVKILIDRNRTKNEINAATLKKFGVLWERNCNKNKQWIKELSGIETLKSKKPVKEDFLIVAAGPSLEKELPKMKALKEKYTIVCVETALRALLGVGVQPDFIILMDPQYWAYRHIAGLHAPESTLITEISTYPSVFRFDCKNILLSASQIPYGKKLESEAKVHFGDLGAGGSVASAAWNFAHYCGAKKIVLAGLDLAYPGKQTHVKGSSAEQTFLSTSNRLRPVETMNTAALHSVNSEMGEDYAGKPVLTDARMKMFAWWFESRIAACPAVKTYTLGVSGLKIPGVEPLFAE